MDSSARYDEIVGALRRAYDDRAHWRDGLVKSDWKVAERKAFLDRLRADGASRLLEVGAGPGTDSRFFADQGLDVVATDLSPVMVELCRAKGLQAQVRDVLHLDLPAGSFDAVYTLNCLLHVPNTDLPAALAAIHGVLRPSGLLFLGVWGGDGSEGTMADDEHTPPRFFSWRTDAQLQAFVAPLFDIVDFHPVEVGRLRFQSLTARVGGSA